jgi:hypothetical protein
LLCFNLRESDLSFYSDQSILHLANLLSLEPTLINYKVGKKRQFLHAILTKLGIFFTPARPAHLPGLKNSEMVGAGIIHKGKTFVTHSTLREHHSAANSFTASQLGVFFTVIAILTIGLVINPVSTMVCFTAILSAIYFLDVLFNLYLVGKSIHTPPELSFSAEDINALTDQELPVYTILVPLYKEANVLAHFVDSMASMNYPKNKLDILLLLEDDKETIKWHRSHLPQYIRSIVVQTHFQNQTKACNYGLAFAKVSTQ